MRQSTNIDMLKALTLQSFVSLCIFIVLNSVFKNIIDSTAKRRIPSTSIIRIVINFAS